MTTARIALFLSLGATAFAANWSGKLIDASCHENQKQPGKAASTCMPSAATSSFALQTTDGKVFKLDQSGNRQALQAIKTDAGKAERVTVTGAADGQTLKVESIAFGLAPKK